MKHVHKWKAVTKDVYQCTHFDRKGYMCGNDAVVISTCSDDGFCDQGRCSKHRPRKR